MDKYNKDELEKMIVEQNKTYSSIGNMYGVSGNAIKKAAKRMGIIVPKRRKINPQENFKHYGTRISSFVNRISDENFIEIINSSNTWKEIGAKLGYKNQLSYNVKESIIKRCEKLGMSLVFDKKEILGSAKIENLKVLLDNPNNFESIKLNTKNLKKLIDGIESDEFI